MAVGQFLHPHHPPTVKLRTLLVHGGFRKGCHFRTPRWPPLVIGRRIGPTGRRIVVQRRGLLKKRDFGVIVVGLGELWPWGGELVRTRQGLSDVWPEDLSCPEMSSIVYFKYCIYYSRNIISYEAIFQIVLFDAANFIWFIYFMFFTFIALST